MLKIVNRKQKIQAGFTVVEILIIILILAVIGFGGYYVWHTQHSKKNPVATISTSSKTTLSTKAATTNPTAPNPYAGWKTYTLPVEKLSFMYPSNWTLSNSAPTATQDSATLTTSDGSTFYINDGVPNGGDSTPEAPSSSAIAVTFLGQPDYLVPVYGTGSVGHGSSDGLIGGVLLQTSPSQQTEVNGGYPLPTDKTAVGPNDTTGAINAMYIQMGITLNAQITLQQVPTNTDIHSAGLIVASMHY
jgi:Tfp pilus assembly protein PilE